MSREMWTIPRKAIQQEATAEEAFHALQRADPELSTLWLWAIGDALDAPEFLEWALYDASVGDPARSAVNAVVFDAIDTDRTNQSASLQANLVSAIQRIAMEGHPDGLVRIASGPFLVRKMEVDNPLRGDVLDAFHDLAASDFCEALVYAPVWSEARRKMAAAAFGDDYLLEVAERITTLVAEFTPADTARQSTSLLSDPEGLRQAAYRKDVPAQLRRAVSSVLVRRDRAQERARQMSQTGRAVEDVVVHDGKPGIGLDVFNALSRWLADLAQSLHRARLVDAYGGSIGLRLAHSASGAMAGEATRAAFRGDAPSKPARALLRAISSTGSTLTVRGFHPTALPTALSIESGAATLRLEELATQQDEQPEHLVEGRLLAADSSTKRAKLLLDDGTSRSGVVSDGTLIGVRLGDRYQGYFSGRDDGGQGRWRELTEVPSDGMADAPEHLDPITSREIPQAPNLDRLARLVRITSKQGSVSPHQLGVQHDRTVDYYRRAAKILSFLAEDGGVTSAGRILASLSANTDYLPYLAAAFTSSNLALRWVEFSGVDDPKALTPESARRFVDSEVGATLSVKTKDTRAATLRTWLKKLRPFM